jgi:hypothetical protein
MVLSLYGGLFAFDLYLSISRHPAAMYLSWTDLKGGTDLRRKWEVVSDFRKSGARAQLSLPPNHLTKPLIGKNLEPLIPLGGVSNILTVLCNETGQYVNYRSDEKGFNNPLGLFRGNVDIIALGDSFTQGVCPAPKHHMISLIRKKYPFTINLGMVSNGPLINLAALKEYGPALKPKVVLWFHFPGNDFDDLDHELTSPLKRRYLVDGFSQNLVRRQREVDELLGRFLNDGIKKQESRKIPRIKRLVLTTSQKAKGAILLRSFRQWALWTYFKKPKPSAGNFVQFRKIMEMAKRIVSAWNGKLVFVYLPQVKIEHYGAEIKGQNKRVKDIVKLKGFDYLDAEAEMAKRGDVRRLFYRPGSHYNDEGNQQIADFVLQHLSVKYLRP